LDLVRLCGECGPGIDDGFADYSIARARNGAYIARLALSNLPIVSAYSRRLACYP